MCKRKSRNRKFVDFDFYTHHADIYMSFFNTVILRASDCLVFYACLRPNIYIYQKFLLPEIWNHLPKTRHPYLEKIGRQHTDRQTESAISYYTDGHLVF